MANIVLTKVGVNTNWVKISLHQAAATSAAFKLEVPMDKILRTAGWPSERTF